ncbi:hypothetical protein ACFZC3_09655 [Streptomyces sp. NPDC007903]|uniref:hypothetical protein n=1 Tax=Streptomyces sp. NPDC007903 TaxID=3364786 RepID=UPI0036E068DB
MFDGIGERRGRVAPTHAWPTLSETSARGSPRGAGSRAALVTGCSSASTGTSAGDHEERRQGDPRGVLELVDDQPLRQRRLDRMTSESP